MSILRLHSLYVISVSTDPTWDNVGAATWCKYFIIQAQSKIFENFSYSFCSQFLGVLACDPKASLRKKK